MIWLTWRQFRVQAWAATALLAALAVVLVVNGTQLARMYAGSGVTTCQTQRDCAKLAGDFLTVAQSSHAVSVLFFLSVVVLYVTPAVIGIFWGAPLVTREIEVGTHRLVWNQSVTGGRWLAVKFGFLGLAAVVAAGLLSLMVTWWASPIERAGALVGPAQQSNDVNRLTPLMFGARGVAPIGYAAFAFALGVAAGVLIRRTVPAMAITLTVFAGVQVAWPLWVRAHLIGPLTKAMPLDTANLGEMVISPGGAMTLQGGVNMPGVWVVSNVATTASGKVFTGPAPQACGKGSPQACQAALDRLHLRQVITYQPASRYWDFQWLELGIFLAFALALAGFCLWVIRRRRLA